MVEKSVYKIDKEVSSKEKMLRGSAWMTSASIFSRILGAIYIIPWYSWFGTYRLQANALYAKGYTVYAVFLMLSTAGIPSAVSKQVAHYNSLNEYGVSKRLYKRTFMLMFLLGIFMAIILWLAAPILAAGDTRTIPVFRSLAIALTVIPCMSLTRGFFQGYQDMEPSAVSQLVEQVVRVIYMLATAFLIMKVMNGNYELGVVQSTFAAFVGAIGGMLTLGVYYLRKKGKFDSLIENSNNIIDVSNTQLIKELIAQSIPFIFIGIATTLYNLVDQYSFPFIMKAVTNYSDNYIDAMYALFAANANKLIMISISLASAMAATTIPLLIEAITKNERKLAQKQLVDTIELFFFIMLPSSLGIAAVARPLYVVFYGYSTYGVYILKVSAYTAILQGLFLILASLLQGVYENKHAIIYAIVGIAVKLIIQYPLTVTLEAFGPLIASAIGMLVSSFLMLRFLKKNYSLNLKQIQGTFNLLMIFTLIMFLIVSTIVWISGLLFNQESRIIALVEIVFSASLGGYVYVILSLKTRIADHILGAKVERIRTLLHIK